MAESFETYLYKKHGAVHVSPLSETATKLNLLDVFIKTDSKGHFPSHPVLYNSGSMLDLGTACSPETHTRLSQGLKQFGKLRGSGGVGKGLFEWIPGEFDIVEETFSSASALTGSLLGGVAAAELHFSGAKELTCKVENLHTASVDKGFLVNAIADKPPRWKPDITKSLLQWSQPSCIPGVERGQTLWIVHQILYATKVVIESADSSSRGGQVCVLVPGAAAMPGTPSSVGGGVMASHENTNRMEVTIPSGSPGRFKFGFRALRFEFSSAGDYRKFEHDAGNARPIHRGEEDGPHDDPRAQIRDLFVESPPEDYYSDDDEEDEGWDVQRLPIEENVHTIAADANPN